MTPKELAEIRTADGTTDTNYIDRGVLDVTEVREKLARDPESGYQGIDVTKIPEPPGSASVGSPEVGNVTGEEGEENENEDVP